MVGASFELSRISSKPVSSHEHGNQNEREMNMSTTKTRLSEAGNDVVRVIMGDCKPQCFFPTGHRSVEGSKLDLRSLEDSGCPEDRWSSRPLSKTLTVEVRK